MALSNAASRDTSLLLKIVAVLAMAFGVVTMISGGSILHGVGNSREMAGAFVPFVVWFNFGAGALYLLTAVGIWKGRSWAFSLAVFIAAATALVASAFALHVIQGGAFEMRTVGALTFRTGFWVVIAIVLHRRGTGYHGIAKS